MAVFDCNCKPGCTGIAVIVSLVVGVVVAFLQITGVLLLTPLILWVLFAVAAVYLATTLLAAFFARNWSLCACSALSAFLTGVLGSVLLSAVLLTAGVIPAGILGAVVTGLAALFFTLMVTSAACLIRCLTRCRN